MLRPIHTVIINVSCGECCRAEDGCVELAKTTSTASTFAKEAENARRQQKRDSVWVRRIFQFRQTRGEYHYLIAEMRLGNSESFYRYFHITPQRFPHMLSLVGPSITRSDTTFRCAISPGERLAITLCFLVTGDSMQTISFRYCVGHSVQYGWLKYG